MSEFAVSGYARGLNFAPSGAGFYSPISLALDAAGNVFVVNYGNGYIGSVSELTAASGYAKGLKLARSSRCARGFWSSLARTRRATSL